MTAAEVLQIKRDIKSVKSDRRSKVHTAIWPRRARERPKQTDVRKGEDDKPQAQTSGGPLSDGPPHFVGVSAERTKTSAEGRNMKILPDDSLMKCPRCGAWPMSNATKASEAPYGRITFRCAKCHAQPVYTVGVAGRLILAPAGRR